MHHVIPERGLPVRTFRQSLSSTPRGARLARLLGVAELRTWGVPMAVRERAELVIAELASNASRHGRLPGRDFRLGLSYTPSTGRLEVEVTDPRGDFPAQVTPPEPDNPEEPDAGTRRPGGWGLSLVTAVADDWHVVRHPPSGKTVRAVLTTTGGADS